jgi:hypothetical protein
VQVDAGDEAGARPGADGHVGAELHALAVVGDRVGVGLAAAGQLGDVLAPGQPEVLGGLAERAPEALRVGVEAGELVEAQQCVEDVGGAAIRAVGGGLVGGLGELQVPGLIRRPPHRFLDARRRPDVLGSGPGAVCLRPAGRLAERGAQPGDRLGVLGGRLAQLLDLAQQLLAMRAHRLQLVEQRLVGGQPLVGGLAPRPGRLLGLLAALGQVRLGGVGACFGTLQLSVETLGAREQLAALGVGGLAAAPGGLRLTAQVLDSGQIALGLLLARGQRPALVLGLAQPREQRRARDLGVLEELLPRPEDVDDVVGVRPFLAAQPVLGARHLAGQDDPAVQRVQVVGLLDQERDLAQARVGTQRRGRAVGAGRVLRALGGFLRPGLLAASAAALAHRRERLAARRRRAEARIRAGLGAEPSAAPEGTAPGGDLS